jgi:methyl-accepting chemotaxis protein
MTTDSSASRRHIFVDKKFQARFILNYVLLIVLGTLIFNAAAYLILDHQIGESLFSAHLAIQRTGDLLLPTLLYLSLTFVLILGLASVFITLIVSHRISGPLFAIMRYLRLMADGQFNFEAKLRTKDQTAVLADTLTETVKTLGGRVVMIKEAVDRAKKDMTILNSSVGEKALSPELIRTVHDLNEHLRLIEERLALFKTE